MSTTDKPPSKPSTDDPATGSSSCSARGHTHKFKVREVLGGAVDYTIYNSGGATFTLVAEDVAHGGIIGRITRRGMKASGAIEEVLEFLLRRREFYGEEKELDLATEFFRQNVQS